MSICSKDLLGVRGMRGRQGEEVSDRCETEAAGAACYQEGSHSMLPLDDAGK